MFRVWELRSTYERVPTGATFYPLPLPPLVPLALVANWWRDEQIRWAKEWHCCRHLVGSATMVVSYGSKRREWWYLLREEGIPCSCAIKICFAIFVADRTGLDVHFIFLCLAVFLFFFISICPFIEKKSLCSTFFAWKAATAAKKGQKFIDSGYYARGQARASCT